MPRTTFVPFILVGLVAGCATVPTRFSAHSAASPEASAPPPVVVARALIEEPPLPGQTGVDAWHGLAPAADPAPDPHAHHHHHPGMVMPAPSSAAETTTTTMEPSHAP